MGWDDVCGDPDRAVRRARIRAHAAFDPLWQAIGRSARKHAYDWLAWRLGRVVHMADADLETCYDVISVCAGAKPGDIIDFAFGRERDRHIGRLKRDVRSFTHTQ